MKMDRVKLQSQSILKKYLHQQKMTTRSYRAKIVSLKFYYRLLSTNPNPVEQINIFNLNITKTNRTKKLEQSNKPMYKQTFIVQRLFILMITNEILTFSIIRPLDVAEKLNDSSWVKSH